MLFFFQAEAGIRDIGVTGVQTCALPIFSVRRREAEAAEALVAEEAERFRTWQASLAVVPAIASLRAWAEEIRRRELAKAEARLGRLNDAERRAVEAVTAQIVAKLLHRPTVRLKEAAAAADGVLYADAVRDLFGLEDER